MKKRKLSEIKPNPISNNFNRSSYEYESPVKKQKTKKFSETQTNSPHLRIKVDSFDHRLDKKYRDMLREIYIDILRSEKKKEEKEKEINEMKISTKETFTEILPNELYLSGVHYSLKDIQNEKIKTIINVDEEKYNFNDIYDNDVLIDMRVSNEELEELKKNVEIIHFPMEDNIDQDILCVIEKVNEIMERKTACPVLIHCLMGVSRSPSIVIGYLMKKLGMSFKEGLKFVMSKRKGIFPNYSFCNQLDQYEGFLKEKKS